MQVSQTVAPPAYWDALYRARRLVYDEDSVLFKDLFARYLRPGGTCFEIGCYPGGFLIYLGKTFGYTVGGIDTTPEVAALPDHVRAHGVTAGSFFNGDFLTYRPDQQYDVVCSFGFIEHFRNYREMIRRHVDLLKPGGTLVISCPNFRHLQGVFHRIFDTANLRRHVLAAMNFRGWNEVLSQCGMEMIYQSYYGTCELWREPDGRRRLVEEWLARQLIRASRSVDARIRYPNRYTSPYMVTFARKALAGGSGAVEPRRSEGGHAHSGWGRS